MAFDRYLTLVLTFVICFLHCVCVNTNKNRPPPIFTSDCEERQRWRAPAAGIGARTIRCSTGRPGSSPARLLWVPTRAVTSEGEKNKNLLY